MSQSSLNIAFAGTPEFAACHLYALIQAGFKISAVLTRPDKPAGRGQRLQESEVKKIALQHHLLLFQPRTLKDEAGEQLIRSLSADVIVTVAYGLILPKNILSIPRLGFINVHPSLLPRFRGPSPIQYPILEGDVETGVSIMQVDEGIDTGPVLSQSKYFLSATETASSLHDRLSELGVTALTTVLKRLQNQETISPILQTEVGACYASKITKQMATLDWRKPAIELDRMIRAFNDWPVAHTTLSNETIRVWRAEPLTEKTSAPAGKVIRINDDSIDVATGDGVLRIFELQFQGGKRLLVKEILKSKQTLFHGATLS